MTTKSIPKITVNSSPLSGSYTGLQIRQRSLQLLILAFIPPISRLSFDYLRNTDSIAIWSEK